MVKVSIDVQSTLGRKTGFGTYVLGLLQGFQEIQNPPTFVFCRHPKKEDMRTWERLIWDQCLFPRLAFRGNPDIIHKPCFSAPLLQKLPVILTVPDIIPYLYPKNFSWTARSFWNGVLIASIKRATFLITISESAKCDLVHHLGIDPHRIAVTSLGVSEAFHFRPRDEAMCVLARSSVPKKFFLCVGSLEPRKNIPFLISSYLSVAASLEEDLVVVGKAGWGVDHAVREILARSPLSSRVHFTDYLDDAVLPFFYNAATALLFPSLYEGFGLPVLEALASECPVICSNTSSLPEVTGTAAWLLSPQDESAWRAAMLRIAGDAALREQMQKAGREQAQKFSWKRCAQETLTVYMSVFGDAQCQKEAA